MQFQARGGPRGTAYTLGSCPHLKTVNLAASGGISAGDIIYEDGDADRRWIVVSYEDTIKLAAGSNENNNGILAIGPSNGF